ncbi:hypothetical protein EGI22_10195 [Lacihabitans sp. LS3-19]|uniref:hypothetical protein n=1 Tax=Lacihabitans sp. LS3-19 TaxID=2487335 RepID=UPI0020CE90CF|nr:hypothetical protein [Lacihabitans sp. LS3-19]MCP9768283.1 hypothetical protein [Lacihabitans sp. LS3-19]
MTTNQSDTALSETIHSWGFASIQDFAREQAKNILQQKIAHYQSQISFFEQKYGSTFDTFCKDFDKITNHSVIEKEDDSIRWEVAIDVIKEYKNDFSSINA